MLHFAKGLGRQVEPAQRPNSVFNSNRRATVRNYARIDA